jgi:hypothetical protein
MREPRAVLHLERVCGIASAIWPPQSLPHSFELRGQFAVVKGDPRRRFCLWIAFVFVGGLAAFRTSVPELRAQEPQGTSDIAVVVSADNPISDISLATLRKVVLGDVTSWKNHANVVLVLRPEGTPERDTVMRVVARMTNSQFKQYWMGKVFRGEANAEPLTVASKGLMLEYLGGREGGIAFIEAPKMFPHIKIVTVNGLRPGESTYPLR